MDSELLASSEEADSAAGAGVGCSADPETSSTHETPKDPNAPSSLVADPEGVPVSVRSSLELEAVTTPDATFLGVDLAARVVWDVVEVLGGTTRGHTHHQSQ